MAFFIASRKINCSKSVSVVDRRFIQAMKAQGIPVHVWTINDASEMHRLLDMGVDGIMTDRPGLLKSILISRKQWS